MPATYEPIATQTLGSDAADVTFSNIPDTYTDLVLVTSGLSSRTASNVEAMALQFNGDTGSNYSNTEVLGDGSTTYSFRNSSTTTLSCGRLNSSSSSNTNQSILVLNVMSYSNSNVYTTTLSASASSQEKYSVGRHVGLWRSTAVVTSIKLTPALGPNFKSGSTFSLYGIKAA